MSKAHRFLQITAKHQDFPFLYRISKDKKLYPKMSRQLSYRFRFNFTNIEASIGGKSSCDRF